MPRKNRRRLEVLEPIRKPRGSGKNKTRNGDKRATVEEMGAAS